MQPLAAVTVTVLKNILFLPTVSDKAPQNVPVVGCTKDGTASGVIMNTPLSLSVKCDMSGPQYQC